MKYAIYILWITITVGFVIYYLFNPEILEVNSIKSFLYEFSSSLFAGYIFLTLIRGIFLIPSTPFVLLGAVIFPDNSLMVLGISMFGVVFSATLLYFFSDLLGFSKSLEKNYPNQSRKWKQQLSQPKATWLIVAWSFFPFVPTDLICYIAGIVKMKYQYLIIGVFIGEFSLNIFYVYVGQSLSTWLFG